MLEVAVAIGFGHEVQESPTVPEGLVQLIGEAPMAERVTLCPLQTVVSPVAVIEGYLTTATVMVSFNGQYPEEIEYTCTVSVGVMVVEEQRVQAMRLAAELDQLMGIKGILPI